MTPSTFKFNKDFNKLKKLYGRDPNDVKLNGHKIFENMTERQQRRVGKVFGGSARYDKNIVGTAHTIAESMKYNTADELMSVIEIVAATVEGMI